MYNILTTLFTAYNGVKALFHYRQNTSDFNTILSILEHDEYKTKDIPVKDGDVIIDIGSHIGAFPILFSALKLKVGIYCYEPIPENYRLLFKNLEDNDLQDFGYCWQKAVVGKPRDKVKIYYGDDSFDGLAHKFIGTPVFDPPPGWDRKFCEAETITLEQIFKENKIERCKLLKIDCEGFEYEIFENAPKEILDKIDFVVGEYHGNYETIGMHPRMYLQKLFGENFEDITHEKTDLNQGAFFFKHK